MTPSEKRVMLPLLGIILMPMISLILASQREMVAASGAWIAWSICILAAETGRNGREES